MTNLKEHFFFISYHRHVEEVIKIICLVIFGVIAFTTPAQKTHFATMHIALQ